MKIKSLNELLNIVIDIYYHINSTCIISDTELWIDTPEQLTTFDSEYDLLMFLLNEINLSLEYILL